MISLQKLFRQKGSGMKSSKSWKEKNLNSRTLSSAILSLKLGGKIKDFSDKQKLKDYNNTKPNLKEILKGPLQTAKKQESIGKGKITTGKDHGVSRSLA